MLCNHLLFRRGSSFDHTLSCCTWPGGSQGRSSAQASIPASDRLYWQPFAFKLPILYRQWCMLMRMQWPLKRWGCLLQRVLALVVETGPKLFQFVTVTSTIVAGTHYVQVYPSHWYICKTLHQLMQHFTDCALKKKTCSVEDLLTVQRFVSG